MTSAPYCRRDAATVDSQLSPSSTVYHIALNIECNDDLNG